jgi:transposase
MSASLTIPVQLSITRTCLIDSEKIAAMPRGGMFPMAYAYPKQMRATRDLLRRREYFVRHQAELYTHIENTNSQYNFDATLETRRMKSAVYRRTLPERFSDSLAQKTIHADLFLADAFHVLIADLEKELQTQASAHDPRALALLRTIPGIGDTLSLVMLYEIHDIHRFPAVGNVHLKWAFSEAAVSFLRKNEPAQKMHQKLVAHYGKAKALSLIAQKLGRTVYAMLRHDEPFDTNMFFQDGRAELHA